MKSVETFGNWILTTGTGRLFFSLVIMGALGLSAWSNHTVKIDAKNFECTATEAHGIEARCTQYTWTKRVR